VNERSYNVGTGVATSVVDLANALLAAAGSSTPIEFAAKRPGELQDSCLNVDKARAVLGWEPRMSLADGLANTYAWSAGRVTTPVAAASRP
jgi:UDP-glucose 4-epimerase